MYYLVGLGNPGEKYSDTRHNVGWFFVEALIEKVGLPSLVNSSKYSGRINEGMLAGEELTCLLPDTYMNKSGSAVAKLVLREEVGNLVVVYDDVALPVGEVKISVGKGSGGHNGIQSIIDALGSKDFIRVRVGIAPVSFWTGKTIRPKGEKMSRHVLGKFGKKEQKQIADLADQFTKIMTSIVTEGVEVTMNKFNGI
ncbi:aminoacyl-tRNA hydrolase [Candidatus Kaiserbacteria bacterium]|nr:aminoacyl-tRNA hydrolase [Candidatus Kaiserbacteria bacterium]